MSTETPSKIGGETAEEQQENSVLEPAVEQKRKRKRKRGENLAPYQFKPGQSGNPGGRPKGSSLKVWVQNMILEMNDEERMEFLKGLSKDKIWEMAEGKPKTDVEVSGKLSISTVLSELENDGQTPLIEGMEDPAPVQDPQQAATVSEIQAQPSPGTLSPTQMVQESDPQV